MAQTATELLEREHCDISELFDRVRSPDEDRASALRELVQRLATHVAVEQAIVFPELRHSSVRDGVLEGELKHDYQAIGHDLVLIERRKANSPDQPELVTEVHDVFRAHVERCRQRLYPDLEQDLSSGQLQQLAERLAAAGEVVVSHPHPHPHPYLLSLGPLSRVTTRIAARLERVRPVGEWGGLSSTPSDNSTAGNKAARRSKGTTGTTSRRSRQPPGT